MAKPIPPDCVFYCHEAAALLSTDLVTPFLWRMGIEVPDARPLQTTFRWIVEHNRATFGTSSIQELHAFGVTLRRTLTDRFGAEFRDSFEIWFAEMFCFSGDAKWYPYLLAFIVWARDLRLGREDIIGFGEQKEKLRALFLEAQGKSDLDLDIAASLANDRTEWDKGIGNLMRYSYDEELVRQDELTCDETPLIYPFDRVIQATERNRFQIFWEAMLTMADDAALEALQNLARRHLKTDVVPPRSLRRTLSWPDPSSESTSKIK
jgi:hypothetical protein